MPSERPSSSPPRERGSDGSERDRERGTDKPDEPEAPPALRRVSPRLSAAVSKVSHLGRHHRLIGGTNRGLSPLTFGLVTVVLGVAGGLAAYAFRVLIAVVHNLAFLGTLSVAYDANQHTPASAWGLGVALVPPLGALIVVFLIERFAPEAKGHGVPEVMDAIYYNKGVIRPVVAAIKSVASALSIGTGGSVGREGPIIQIAAAFASLTGQLSHVSRWQQATLVAAGGGAGIAATFNTPIGGVLFAVEVLLHEISVRTLVPVAVATTTATYVARGLFGDHPAFPVLHVPMPEGVAVLPTYVVLGVVTALASVLFIRALYAAEDRFESVFDGHPYLAHVVGMAVVGVIFTGLFAWRGHYFVQGIGYATIVDVLTSPVSVWFLVALFVLKLAVTMLTLGSGGSGGIFSPALFMGATIGGAFGVAVSHLLPSHNIQPAVFALAGMAGMVSGTTGAVLTAVVMLFEMTLDYAVVLPMVLTASVSHGLRRLLLADSIYTMKLTRRGHTMPEALQANAHLVHHVSDIALSTVVMLEADRPPGDLDLEERDDAPTHVVLLQEGRVVGAASLEWARGHAEALSRASRIGDALPDGHIVVSANSTIFDLIARLQKASASVAVVVAAGTDDGAEPPKVLGVVPKAHLVEVLAEGMELFTD